MSLQHLQDLGDQILRAIEHDQLQSEIAVISLENMHAMIANPRSSDDDPKTTQQSYPPMNNMYVDNNPNYPGYQPNPFFMDEQVVPAVIGPQYNSDLMLQAQSIPFLFHQPGPTE